MDEFDNIIEKYRRELLEFSKNNPDSAEKCPKSCADDNSITEQHKAITVNANKNQEADGEAVRNITEPLTSSEFIQNTAETAGNTIQTEIYEAPQFDNYEDFLRNNPQNGLLKVQVFAAGQAFPVANARVTVTLELKSGPRQMFDGLTDINGIADNIKLPAPSAEMSQAPSDSAALPYSTYTTFVEHPYFVDAEFANVPVFAGIKSIQSVSLIPEVNIGNQPQMTEFNEGESFTRLKGEE